MGHKNLLMQFAIIALVICSSCGVRRYKYGSRIRSLAERRNYRQPKDYYSANSILRSNYKMKNIYEQGKNKYYKYSKRFRKQNDGFNVPELKTTTTSTTTTTTTTPSAPATTKTSVSVATSISTSVSTSYKYSIQDHKKRLRKLLVPLPRHIAGPRPTISSPSPEVEDREEEFVCPVFSRDARSGRNWRAFPDPSSCRHYYICLIQQERDLGEPVRHSCEEGRNFNKETETCDLISDEEPRCGDPGDHGVTIRPRGHVRPVTAESEHKERMSREKQGLFVEFIQFLIRIGMFNKNTVISMLNNKDLFL